MHGYPAATAKRSRRLTVAAGPSVAPLLDRPAIDSLEGEHLGIQRGHFLLTCEAPAPGAAARRSIEWRLTTQGRDASVIARGKASSNNVNGPSALVEPSRTGGVLIPVFGGVVLEVADYNMTGGDQVTVDAIYCAGSESLRAPEWPVSYPASLASNAAPGTPGTWIEMGPAPFGCTRLQIQAPNVANDASAPGPIECEWLFANGTRAAFEMMSDSTGLRLPPQGYHARIRTSGAYGASGFTPRVIFNWS